VTETVTGTGTDAGIGTGPGSGIGTGTGGDDRPAPTAGIPLGDGTYLPPLHGVPVDDGIPPSPRDPRLPPPGPVIAKLTDGRGQQWWLHRDGSHSSCSFAEVRLADGRRRWIVSTQHGAPLPAAAGERGRGRLWPASGQGAAA